MRLPLVIIIPGLLLLAGCLRHEAAFVPLPAPKPEVRVSLKPVPAAAEQSESAPQYGPPLFLSPVALLDIPAAAPAPASKPAPLSESTRKVSALAPGKVHAHLLSAFRQLDRYPLLVDGAGPLRNWANKNGHCAITYTHRAQIALETTDFDDRSFPVPEAVPVDCGKLDDAYEAAVKEDGYSNVEKIEGGRIAAMRHVNGKRDALKRDFTMLVLENQGKTILVEARGMGEASL